MALANCKIRGAWISTYYSDFTICHNWNGANYARIEWPNGECYLKQDKFMVDMFTILQNQLTAMKKDS